jgi:hypothetical protein
MKFKHNSRIAILGTLLLVLSISVVNTSCTNIAPFFTDTVPSFFKGLVSELAPSGETQHTINVGTEVDLATQTVDPSGGVVSIDKPGDPLDGLEIEVPAGSYGKPRSFKVSYAPVTGHDFGDNFHPTSPLIKIDNGGGYSDEIMMVIIPAEIPEGKFAMAFFYDDQAGKLEGIPIVEEDATHITIAARHFSKIVVSSIPESALGGDVEIDSGFFPGIDDWQFTNYGSYIAPHGHCAGQSMTALWYYTQMKSAGWLSLYGRYNEGTRDFWYDDARAYRFASEIQKDIDWDAWSVRYKILKPKVQNDNSIVWKQFVYSMKLTGEPQFIGISNTVVGGGHAMIVYAISGGALQIADPNYPGSLDREIWYENGEFEAYNSGENARAILNGEGKEYDLILYIGASSLVDFDTISSRWSEFEEGTIGNDRFPAYTLHTTNQNGDIIDLRDGYSTQNKTIDIELTSTIGGLAFQVYRDEELLPAQQGGNKYSLEPGNNELGIYVVGDNGNGWQYVDFKYVNVVYETEEVKPPEHGDHPVVDSIKGPSGPIMGPGPYEYTIEISGGTPPYFVEWRGNNVIYSGTGYETVNILRDQLRDNGEGYWVFITVKDSADKYAQWVNEDGITKQEFTYGALNNGLVVTEPESFPYDMLGD